MEPPSKGASAATTKLKPFDGFDADPHCAVGGHRNRSKLGCRGTSQSVWYPFQLETTSVDAARRVVPAPGHPF